MGSGLFTSFRAIEPISCVSAATNLGYVQRAAMHITLAPENLTLYRRLET